MTSPDVPVADASDGRDVVVATIEELLADSRVDGAAWENSSLERYLEALGALLGSIEHAYNNSGQERPSLPYQVMADTLDGRATTRSSRSGRA